MGMTLSLRERLDTGEVLVAHGAWDALTARMAEQAGAAAVYMSGSCVSSSVHGGPDIGLTTMTEMAERARQMAGVLSVPLVADGDTGYGNALNVRRTVQEYERAGVAAIQLEDQDFPKKCGHFAGKRLVDAAEFAAKVEAAVDAREHDDFLVIARTDAIAVSGVDDAVARAELYREAGADVLFVEAPTSPEMMREVTNAVPGPHLANMAAKGKTPPLSHEELAELGYDVVIHPSDAFKAALKTVREVYEAVVAEGSQRSVLDRMVEWDERDDITAKGEWDALEENYDASETEYRERLTSDAGRDEH
jgi:2-methylisocitrate lyase-like PEP mutase family enzyme